MLNHDVYEMNFTGFAKRKYKTKDTDIEARLIANDPYNKKIKLYDIKKDRIIAELGYTGFNGSYSYDTHCCGASGFGYGIDDVCPACSQSRSASDAAYYVLEELAKEGLITKYYMRYDGSSKGFTKIYVAK
jgi:hypothetical protein